MNKNNPKLKQFAAFHSQNPKVYKEIVRRAREFRKRKPGGTIGIALIYNLMRWDNALSTSGDVFKLRNDFMPFYARLVMKTNPDLKDVFEIRKMFSNG